MKPRLLAALLAYGVLAALAGVTLEGKFRLAVWILLAALLIRTLLAARQNP